MKRKLIDYQEELFKKLKDPEFAYCYLNEAFADDDPSIFLLALKDVYQAQGAYMTDLALKTNLSRENIYRILSKKGNPRLTSLSALIKPTGFLLGIQHPKKR